ncbi:unnamed protein product [marine sediment metagenome]|uniref:HpcH/HpaI aldolase/citrate lyase domain-containing protein n=1 Tax=marine sediment metagenome TaxID=412755 RepID=X1VN89_9ZZZZ
MKNTTKAKLKAGKAVIGVRLDFTSPAIVESMGGLGFDFVYFDLEHGLAISDISISYSMGD